MMMAYPACPRLWFRYPCELSNPPLQQPNATRASARRWARSATPRAAPAAPRGRGTLEGDLGVRC
jgi:hypothetical protein